MSKDQNSNGKKKQYTKPKVKVVKIEGVAIYAPQSCGGGGCGY